MSPAPLRHRKSGILSGKRAALDTVIKPTGTPRQNAVIKPTEIPSSSRPAGNQPRDTVTKPTGYRHEADRPAFWPLAYRHEADRDTVIKPTGRPARNPANPCNHAARQRAAGGR